MSFDPFNADSSSLEKDDVLGGTVKKVTTVVSDAAKQQAKAAQKAFVDQLYGNTPSADGTEDPQNAQQTQSSNAATSPKQPPPQSGAEQKQIDTQSVHKHTSQPASGPACRQAGGGV